MTKKPSQHIAENIFSSAVNTLDIFVDSSLPTPLRNIDSNFMKHYMCFQMDCVFESMGYMPKYNVANPFPFMDKLTLNEFSKSNFFETQTTQYQAITRIEANRLALSEF